MSTTTAATTFLRALWDKRLFSPWFKDPAGWTSWFAFLKALFALPLSADDSVIYRQCTGRTEPPTKAATESLADLWPPRRQELHPRLVRGLLGLLPRVSPLPGTG